MGVPPVFFLIDYYMKALEEVFKNSSVFCSRHDKQKKKDKGRAKLTENYVGCLIIDPL
jgi:hypothetical protein